MKSLSFGSFRCADVCVPVLEISAEISKNSLRREIGKDQGKTLGKIRIVENIIFWYNVLSFYVDLLDIAGCIARLDRIA